jgi:hypothetical protein
MLERAQVEGSAYPLPPSPDRSTNESILAIWDNGFSEEELSRITRLGAAAATTSATANNSDAAVKSIRQCSIGWLGLSPETQFIYDRLGLITRAGHGEPGRRNRRRCSNGR